MIRRFGFTNFTSFRESVEVNFELDGKTPENIKNGMPASTVMGIKGANGSGKTNILRALAFLSYFCTKGARDHVKGKGSEPTTLVAVDGFFNNDEPVNFYIDFDIDNIRYFYELDVKSGKIIHESLARKSQRSVNLIKRINNTITDRLKAFEDFDNFELSEDMSILEMITKFKFKHDISELRKIYSFFYNIIINVTYDGYTELSFDLGEETLIFYKNEHMFDFVKELIKASDSSIIDIEIRQYKDSKGDDIHLPVFIHRCESGTEELTYSRQSSGTQKLYQVLSAYFAVLRRGGVLALDEFDIHLHAKMLPLIIKLFLNKKINTKNAQFIFTSHNTEIIDTLGKYRTLLVNKEDSESYGYRLDEIPGSMIRNDRPIAPLYVDGKIGGIPTICDMKLESIMERIEYGEK
ncbi:hypothetical protein EDB67_106139 [Vibrio crassostreae]|uniref:AAA family ATPase n=1 Tax=Vibrio crassostreae TaxID=246167 RepID=UPI000F4A350D|nr:ATP-binding protein [Vibrio crassostreae]ROR23833.1 hypothetical protein EDB67_106139 [Vibrio crassostreae]